MRCPSEMAIAKKLEIKKEELDKCKAELEALEEKITQEAVAKLDRELEKQRGLLLGKMTKVVEKKMRDVEMNTALTDRLLERAEKEADGTKKTLAEKEEELAGVKHELAETKKKLASMEASWAMIFGHPGTLGDLKRK